MEAGLFLVNIILSRTLSWSSNSICFSLFSLNYLSSLVISLCSFSLSSSLTLSITLGFPLSIVLVDCFIPNLLLVMHNWHWKKKSKLLFVICSIPQWYFYQKKYLLYLYKRFMTVSNVSRQTPLQNYFNHSTNPSSNKSTSTAYIIRNKVCV